MSPGKMFIVQLVGYNAYVWRDVYDKKCVCDMIHNIQRDMQETRGIGMYV